MFSFWMFVYIAVIGVIPIAIGMIPAPEANDVSAVARFVRWCANHKWWLALAWYFLLTVAPLGITALRNYKNPDIQAQTILDVEEKSSHENGFRWVRSPQSVVRGISWIKTKRNSSGLMWEGITAGVSREDNTIDTFKLSVYASDGGVGHYTWNGGKYGPWDILHNQGHFPLAFSNQLFRNDNFRAPGEEMLRHAIENASAEINRFYRPLDILYNKKTEELKLYDPESGRNVHFTKEKAIKERKLVFGPYPMADGPYLKTPGLHFSNVPEAEQIGLLIFNVQDVYGQPLDHARVSISHSESGYKYEQILPDDMSDMAVTLPLMLMPSNIQIEISRAGYHKLSGDVDLSHNAQRVIVILEPQRRR